MDENKIVLPYIEDPQNHFACIYLKRDINHEYPLIIKVKNQSEKAVEHIEKIELNSYERVISRAEKAILYAMRTEYKQHSDESK